MRKVCKEWGIARLYLSSMPWHPSPHTSPRPDRREKLRVRLMPSQLPGSSLMMPTLVFQVVQFTSSTLLSEEMRKQRAGDLRVMPSFPGQGLGPTGQSQGAHRPGWGDIADGGEPRGACLLDTTSKDVFSDHTMGPRDFNIGFLVLTLITR